MNPKITPEHLGRGAVVYVRQSTMGQVAEQHGKPAAAICAGRVGALDRIRLGHGDR